MDFPPRRGVGKPARVCGSPRRRAAFFLQARRWKTDRGAAPSHPLRTRLSNVVASGGSTPAEAAPLSNRAARRSRQCGGREGLVAPVAGARCCSPGTPPEGHEARSCTPTRVRAAEASSGAGVRTRRQVRRDAPRLIVPLVEVEGGTSPRTPVLAAGRASVAIVSAGNGLAAGGRSRSSSPVRTARGLRARCVAIDGATSGTPRTRFRRRRDGEAPHGEIDAVPSAPARPAPSAMPRAVEARERRRRIYSGGCPAEVAGSTLGNRPRARGPCARRGARRRCPRAVG